MPRISWRAGHVALCHTHAMIVRAFFFAVATFQATPPVVRVCDLVPRAEVKKLIGGTDIFDMMAPTEEPLGDFGSSCNYPGVLIQVVPFQRALVDASKKRLRLETVTGVGEEAYFYENPAGYVELFVKVGPRMVTLQRSIGLGATAASVRPGVMALAKAVIAKLK
jgi:hypothetical protein